MNGRHALATEIKARIRGKFKCSFAEVSRSQKQKFRANSIGAIIPALRERLPLAVTFEERSDFSRMSAEALVEHMNKAFDWGAYDYTMLRTFYPRIDVRVEQKKGPGLQVVDLLLWGALQQYLEPSSHKVKVLTWCGAFCWGHGGSPYPHAKYFVNHRSARLTDRANEEPYPLKIDDLDDLDGDTNTLAHDYCFIERTVRSAAEATLPEHVAHLRPGLRRTVHRLYDPRVSPEHIMDVARQFLRLFDTLPLYEGFDRTDARWLPLVRAKRMAGLCLRQDLVHGGRTLDFFTTIRHRNVRSNPGAFGITRPVSGTST